MCSCDIGQLVLETGDLITGKILEEEENSLTLFTGRKSSYIPNRKKHCEFENNASIVSLFKEVECSIDGSEEKYPV